MHSTPLGRCLVFLKRIANALDRMAPPPVKRIRKAEFSLATAETFEKGYDLRTSASRFDSEEDIA